MQKLPLYSVQFLSEVIGAAAATVCISPGQNETNY
jgi:hypothetical protein